MSESPAITVDGVTSLVQAQVPKSNKQQVNMGQLSYDERVCVKFLDKFKNSADPTWGFWVYGTYSRRQVDNNSHEAQEVADNARFQSVLERLYTYATDSLRYPHPVPYNQQLINALRLEPAAYLPGASLAEVFTHFRQHFVIFSQEEQELLDSELSRPKYGWCLVIDDEALQSIKAAPEPIGHSPPAGVHPSHLAFQAKNAFVILLSASYITMEKPIVLSARRNAGAWQTN
ncbi:hypothetical protein OPT61_g2831 [Boeremia exigua]|uniref:Uncharacterized protein n=1 Tax=Boeremia exigua TaxID=749465 RepID=A0ACC2IK80_9PLEO|nr:hypothetical protein OPT61_g2831 [Boeremia exigua]